jgi:CubicO group peptidase (beta-lactamase class C family)
MSRLAVRHLLTHSSGLQEYLSIPGLPDRAHARTHRKMTRLFVTRIKQEFSPGETWAYSNTGYLLLGDIIERASRQSYWDFLGTRVFVPAGMYATHTLPPATNAKLIVQFDRAAYFWVGLGFRSS